MAVNVKSKSVTNAVSFGGHHESGIARNVEIGDESLSICDDIDICELLGEIDLNVDQSPFKNGFAKTVAKTCDDSIFSLSSLLNEEVFSLLEHTSDENSQHCTKQGENFTVPPFENFEITLSCLAENHLKSEKKDAILPEIDAIDDGLVPDIDLNFCIKKLDENEKFSSICTSPNSSDSGLDEEILGVTATFKDLTFRTELCQEKESTSVLTNPKPSLLSNVILPKIDDIDDGFVPDIDLNFCIKKPDEIEKFSIICTSPNCSDSKLDEEILGVVAAFRTELCQEKESISVSTNPKPSLLSKSLSCRVKSDKSKSEKVKNISRELVRNHFRTGISLWSDAQPQEKFSKNFEDKSNHCVFNIYSRFFVPNH